MPYSTMRLSKADGAKVESIEIEGGFATIHDWEHGKFVPRLDMQSKLIQLRKFGAKGYYWVELNKGFCFDDEGCHGFAEDTQALVRESLKRVHPCNCAHCAN